MPTCCSNPPCGDSKRCKGPKKTKKKSRSSSTSSGKPIPLNEYIEIQTEGFQLKSRKKQKLTEKKKSKMSKKSKQSKKTYNPKKSKLLTTAILASVISPVNHNVIVQPRIDPVLGVIPYSTPENLISRRKHEFRMEKKRMMPIQENHQIFEDEAFAEVLNEYKNNPRAIPKNRPDPNRATYQKTRDRLRDKRMNKKTKMSNTKHKGRKKKNNKKKSK